MQLQYNGKQAKCIHDIYKVHLKQVWNGVQIKVDKWCGKMTLNADSKHCYISDKINEQKLK